jgi:two-component system response regulator YesN
MDWRVKAVRHCVEQQFADSELTLATISAQVRTSAAYLGKLFMKETGQPFRAYLLSLRLAYARALLEHPTLSIKEVVRASGFATGSTFYRLFRSQVGITPCEYRDQQLRRAINETTWPVFTIGSQGH